MGEPPPGGGTIRQAPMAEASSGWTVVELGEVTSTSSEAMVRAQAGARGPLWVRADRQTGGRGRSGRSWLSGEGDLMASLLVAPGCPHSALHQLSLVAGVAVVDAVRSVMAPAPPAPSAASGAPRLRLKWPNDILVGADKLGGILVESSTFGGDLVAVIGIGVNLVEAPRLDGYAATALRRHGPPPPPPARMLATVAARMESWLAAWDKGAGFAAIRAAWLERAGPVGEPMSINTGAGRVAGLFAGLDADGALLLETVDGRLARFTFGDVTLGSAQA